MANHIAKKYTKKGVFILDDENLIKRALNFFPVEDLWGVGRKYAKRLKQSGIQYGIRVQKCRPRMDKKKPLCKWCSFTKELQREKFYDLELNPKKEKKHLYDSFFRKRDNGLQKDKRSR